MVASSNSVISSTIIIIMLMLGSLTKENFVAAQTPPVFDYTLQSRNCYPKSLYYSSLAINPNFVPPPQYIFGLQNSTVSPFTAKPRIIIAESQGTKPVEISDCIFFIQNVQIERLSIRTILSNTDIVLDNVSIRSDIDPDFACITVMDVAAAPSGIANAFGETRKNSSIIVRNSKFDLRCSSSNRNYLLMFVSYGNITDTNFVFENSDIVLDGPTAETGKYFFWVQSKSLFCGGSVIFRNNTIKLNSYAKYNTFFYVGGSPKLAKSFALAAATPPSPTTPSSDRMWGPSEFVFEYNNVNFATTSFSPTSSFSTRVIQTAIFAADVLINTDLIRISNNKFQFEYPRCEYFLCYTNMHQPPRLMITGASADSSGSVDYPTLNLGRVEIEGNDIELGRSMTGFALWQSMHNVVMSSNNEEYFVYGNNNNNNWLGIKIRNNYLHANRFAGCDTNSFRGSTNCLHQFSLLRILPPNQVSPLRSFVVRKGEFQTLSNNNSVLFLIENNTMMDQSTNRADTSMMVSSTSCNPISALIPAAAANEDITGLVIAEIGFFVVSDAVFHIRGNRIVSNVFYGPLYFRLNETERLSTWEYPPDSYYQSFCTAHQVVMVRLLPLANSPISDSFTFNFTSSIVIEDNSIEIQPSAHSIQAEIFFLASRAQTGFLVSQNNNNNNYSPFSLVNNNISFSNPKNFNNTFSILASIFSVINPALSASAPIFKFWVDNGNFVSHGCHVAFGARQRFAFAKTTATILTFQLLVSSIIVESSQFPTTDVFELRPKARASAVIAAGSLILENCSVVMEDYLMIKPIKAGALTVGSTGSIRFPEMTLTLARNIGSDFPSAALSLSVNGDVVITNCLTSVTLSPDLYAYIQERLFWNEKYNHGPDFVLPSSTLGGDDYINFPLELCENNATYHFVLWDHVRGWNVFLDNYPFRVKNFVAENCSVIFSGEGSNFYFNNRDPISKFQDPNFVYKDSPFPCRYFAISFIMILSNLFAVSNFSIRGGQVVVAGVVSQKDKLSAGVIAGKFSFAYGQIENVLFVVRHVVIATGEYHTPLHMFDLNPIVSLVVSNSSMIVDHCSWFMMQLAFVSIGAPTDDNQDHFIHMANPSPQQNNNTFNILLQNNRMRYIGFSVFNSSMITTMTPRANLEQILFPSRNVDPENFLPQYLLPGTGAAVSYWFYVKNSAYSTFDQLQNIFAFMQVSPEADFAFFNGYQSMAFIGTKATTNEIIQVQNIIFNVTGNEIMITADELNDRDAQGATYSQMSLSFRLSYVDLVPTVAPASLRRFVVEIANNKIESILTNNNNNNNNELQDIYRDLIPYAFPSLVATALYVSPLAASDFSSELLPNVTGRLFALNSSIIIVKHNFVNLTGVGGIADADYGAFVVDARSGANWLTGNAAQIAVAPSFSTLILPKYAYHSFLVSNNIVKMTFSSCVDNVTSKVNKTRATSMSYDFVVVSAAITHEFILENNTFVAAFENPLPKLANLWNTNDLHCVADGFSWSMIRFVDPAFTFVVAGPLATLSATSTSSSNLFTMQNNLFEMNFEEGFELNPTTAIEASFVTNSNYQVATEFQSIVVPTVTIKNDDKTDLSSCSLLYFVNNTFEMKRRSSSSSSSSSSAAVILYLAASVQKVFIDKISFLMIASGIFDFSQLATKPRFSFMNFANNTMTVSNLSFWRSIAGGFSLPLEISFSNLLHSDLIFGSSSLSPILNFVSNSVLIDDVHFVAKNFETTSASLRYPPHSTSFLQIHASTISSLNTKAVVVSIEQNNTLKISSSSSAEDTYPAMFFGYPLPDEYFACIISLSSSFWMPDFVAKLTYPKSRISFCSWCKVSSTFTFSVEHETPTSVNALTFVDFETSYLLGDATSSPNMTKFFSTSPRSNFEFSEIKITSIPSSSSSSNNIRLFQFRLDWYSSHSADFFFYFLPTLNLAMTFTNCEINNNHNNGHSTTSTSSSFDQLPTTSFVEIRESPRFLDFENLTFLNCSVNSDIQFNFLTLASRRPTPGVQLNALFNNNSVIARSSESEEMSSFVRFESSSFQPEKYGSQFAGSITFEKNILKEISTRPAALAQIILSPSPSTASWIGSKAKLNFTNNILSAEVTNVISNPPSSLLHVFDANTSSTPANSIVNLGKSQWIVKCNDFKSLPYDWWLQMRNQLLAGNVDQNALEIGRCTETGSISHQESHSHAVTVSNESVSLSATPSALSRTKTFAETKSTSASLSSSRIRNTESHPDSPSKSNTEIFAPPPLKLSQLISQDVKIPIVAASIVSGNAAAFQFTFKINSLSQLSGCDAPDDANEDDVNPNKKVVDPLEFDSNFLMLKLGSPDDGFATHRGALLGNLIIVAIAILLTLVAIIVFAMIRETSFTFMKIKIGFPSQPLAEFIYMLSPPSAAVVVVILAMHGRGNMRNEGMTFVLVAMNVAVFLVYPLHTLMSVILADEGKREKADELYQKDGGNNLVEQLLRQRQTKKNPRKNQEKSFCSWATLIGLRKVRQDKIQKKNEKLEENNDTQAPEVKPVAPLWRKMVDTIGRTCIGPTLNYLLETEHDWVALDAKEFHRRMKIKMANIKQKRNNKMATVESGTSSAIAMPSSVGKKIEKEIDDTDCNFTFSPGEKFLKANKRYFDFLNVTWYALCQFVITLLISVISAASVACPTKTCCDMCTTTTTVFAGLHLITILVSRPFLAKLDFVLEVATSSIVFLFAMFLTMVQFSNSAATGFAQQALAPMIYVSAGTAYVEVVVALFPLFSKFWRFLRRWILMKQRKRDEESEVKKGRLSSGDEEGKKKKKKKGGVKITRKLISKSPGRSSNRMRDMDDGAEHDDDDDSDEENEEAEENLEHEMTTISVENGEENVSASRSDDTTTSKYQNLDNLEGEELTEEETQRLLGISAHKRNRRRSEFNSTQMKNISKGKSKIDAVDI